MLAAALAGCNNPLAATAKSEGAKASSPHLELILASGSKLASGGTSSFAGTSLGASAEIVINISNSGKTALTIDPSRISILMSDGTEKGSFAIKALPPTAIAAGQSGALTLVFNPVSAGAKAATVFIATNDVESPRVSFALAGTGISTGKDITSFGILSPAAAGTISGTNIAITVPYATDVTKLATTKTDLSQLVATFTTTGDSVAVGGIAQTSNSTLNNFTTSQNYTVTATDGSTKVYTVTVTLAPDYISSFGISSPSATGTISGNAIAVTVPTDTVLSSLVASFQSSGTVSVGGTAQVSGSTKNDFTSPVTYAVNMADGSVVNYTVTVSAAPSGSRAITAFSFSGIAGQSTTITPNATGGTIAVSLPFGNALTGLTPIITITGKSVKANGVQGPGDFSAPVSYTVTAADDSTSIYTVTATIYNLVPSVTTSAVSLATTVSASGGGTIAGNGGAAVTASGLCWGTSQNPNLATCSGKTTDGSSSGSWATSMTSLASGSSYYVCAYATNSVGTGYGAQVGFATRPVTPGVATATQVGGPAGSGQLAVSWAAVAGNTVHYDVYWSTSSTPPSSPNGATSLSANSCTLNGLTDYTGYYVWIVAWNSAGSTSLGPTMASPVAPGIHVTGLSLAPSVSLLPGGTSQLAATISPPNATNQNIAWSSSAPGVATVSSAGGLVGAAGIGNATITATTADQAKAATCKVAVTGIITIAGVGTRGFSGDGGSAIAAQFDQPWAVAIDPSGNVLIADTYNFRVRKVTVSTGIISTFAGSSRTSYYGDNLQATLAGFLGPFSLAVDPMGNAYIADGYDQRIRMVSTLGIITTVAGTGVTYYGGGFQDGIAATSARIYGPSGVALDSAGNLYFADCYGYRIRKVDHSTKLISTIAGTGVGGFSGDGGVATLATLNFPGGIAVDTAGNVLFADSGNNRIRRIDTSGKISTIAGCSLVDTAYNGDNIPATSAKLDGPSNVILDPSGNIYFVDCNHGRVRKITNGTITTVAGSGNEGYSGDGGPATSALLAYPGGIALDALGNLYIADTNNSCIRKVVQ